MALAIDRCDDAVLLLDAGGRIVFASRAAERLLAATADSVGRRLEELLPEAVRADAERWLSTITSGRTAALEWESRGTARHLEARATSLLGDPEVETILVFAADRTEQRALEEALAFHALHDDLTGLAGRALFLDRLEQAGARAKRDGYAQVGLIFLDLDRFKALNDELGHPVADCVLAEVGARLRRAVRASDTCARLGGDEFVVVAEAQTAQELLVIAQRALRALRDPIQLDRQAISVTWSVGCALGPGEATAQLLAAADRAMYEAKRDGGDTVRMAALEQAVGDKR